MAKNRSHLNYRAEGFTPRRSEKATQAYIEMSRSSATAPHTSKKFKGTRGDKRKAAINDGY